MKKLAPYLLLVASCGELPDATPHEPVWSNDVETLLSGCTDCHASSARFFDLMSTCSEDGERWVRPADPASPILTVHERTDHASLLAPEDQARLETWVVGVESPFASAIAHERGFSTKHAGAFDPRPCSTCHQQPKELGGSIACTTCHAKPFGVQKCDNCHDHQPKSCDSPAERASGVLHRLHAAGGEDGTFPPSDCASCHPVPKAVVDRGHWGAVDLSVPFDAETKTCVVPACHSTKAQTWAEPSGERCVRCHGQPPENHASAECNDCHRGATHSNRVLDVGTTCDSCHPQSELGGGHARHLAPLLYRDAIECSACHVVPAERDSPGHIDSPRPAEVTVTFDRDTATCANVGCHGANLDGGAEMTPPWGAQGVECGSCHALPPVRTRGGEGVHLPTGTADCGVCHRTPEGLPITIGIEAITEAGRRVHANGRVELAEGL